MHSLFTQSHSQSDGTAILRDRHGNRRLAIDLYTDGNLKILDTYKTIHKKKLQAISNG